MICAIAVAEARFVNAIAREPVDISAIPDSRKSLVSGEGGSQTHWVMLITYQTVDKITNTEGTTWSCPIRNTLFLCV